MMVISLGPDDISAVILAIRADLFKVPSPLMHLPHSYVQPSSLVRSKAPALAFSITFRDPLHNMSAQDIQAHKVRLLKLIVVQCGAQALPPALCRQPDEPGTAGRMNTPSP